MKRLILTAAVLPVAVSFTATAVGHPIAIGIRHGCDRLFSPPMGERAARTVYRGTRTATLQNLRLLGYIERCQRNPADQARIRTYDHHQAALNRLRAIPPIPPMSYAIASWYQDTVGQTACGYHAGMGVANRSLPCGTHVTFEYHDRVVGAVVDDRGPFIAGRTWDLNQSVAGALGFGGVDTVGYHIG